MFHDIHTWKLPSWVGSYSLATLPHAVIAFASFSLFFITFAILVLTPPKFELPGLASFVSEFPPPEGGNPACTIDAAPVISRVLIPDPADRVPSRGPDESVVEHALTPDSDNRVPSPRPKEPIVDEGLSDADTGLLTSLVNFWSCYLQSRI